LNKTGETVEANGVDFHSPLFLSLRLSQEPRWQTYGRTDIQ